MNVLLTIFLCSTVHNSCLPPLEGGMFKDHYSCLKKGYASSSDIIEELGVKDINKQKMFIKFSCKEIKTI